MKVLNVNFNPVFIICSRPDQKVGNLHSEDNLILLVLNQIINSGSPLIMSILDDRLHVHRSFKLVRTSLTSFHSEPLLEGLKRNGLEAREA